MIPILFFPSDTIFTGDGIGRLCDASSCLVKTDREGHGVLTLEYPACGAHRSEIGYGSIILQKPDPYCAAQPYRVHTIIRKSDGLLQYIANHLNYDGSGIPVGAFEASSAADAATKITANARVTCPFQLATDIVDTETMKNDRPRSLRELAVTDSDSWLNTYGGDVVLDGYTIRLLNHAGADRGVVIHYGVDLVQAKQEENIDATYTGIFPFWRDSQTGEIVEGSIRNASGTFPHEKIQCVDLSEFFASKPTAAQLNTAGDQWMLDNQVGKPQVSLTLDYAQIGQDVRLHDIIGVEFELIGISVKAKVSSVTFDGLLEIYKTIEVGDIKPGLGEYMADAGRLKKGLLPAERIRDHSLGSSKFGGGSVTAEIIADGAVTVNKIVNGAVVTEKIAPGAVTGIKVLDQAISYAKLDSTLQTFYTDILAANAIYSNFLHANGSISATWVSTSRLSVGGVEYYAKNYKVKNTNTKYSHGDTYYAESRPVTNNGTEIGRVFDTWYRGYISGSTSETEYNLRVLGPSDAD